MPEGDTIWLTAAALRKRLVGKMVRDARPASITRLLGHRVIDVEPMGKHLIIRFDREIALHSHMRMTGCGISTAPTNAGISQSGERLWC